jgi:hypothetical protein
MFLKALLTGDLQRPILVHFTVPSTGCILPGVSRFKMNVSGKVALLYIPPTP